MFGPFPHHALDHLHLPLVLFAVVRKRRPMAWAPPVQGPSTRSEGKTLTDVLCIGAFESTFISQELRT